MFIWVTGSPYTRKGIFSRLGPTKIGGKMLFGTDFKIL